MSAAPPCPSPSCWSCCSPYRPARSHPGAITDLKLTPQLGNAIVNYVNGKRSAVAIRNGVAAETGQDVSIDNVVGYLELPHTVKWVTWKGATVTSTPAPR